MIHIGVDLNIILYLIKRWTSRFIVFFSYCHCICVTIWIKQEFKAPLSDLVRTVTGR